MRVEVWEFPKIRGTFFRVPYFWKLPYWKTLPTAFRLQMAAQRPRAVDKPWVADNRGFKGSNMHSKKRLSSAVQEYGFHKGYSAGFRVLTLATPDTQED